MKTTLTTIALVFTLVIFNSCRKEINGSGIFILQNRHTMPFDKVMSCGDFNVVLKQDSVPRIELYGEDNILPEIKTEVNASTLTISFKDHHHYDHNGITITIYNPSFSSIDLQGSGKINTQDILASPFVSLKLSGSGKIDAALLSQSVTTNVSGSGKIIVSGNAPYANHTISGSGEIKAFSLASADVKAGISGSGVCEVFASATLDATISGSGTIIYRGTPVVTTHISGSGQVKPD